MHTPNQSPCQTCTRVPHPERCENKRCVPWQRWFLRRWERIHQCYHVLCQERSKLYELEKRSHP